jgi:hypothetical protein
MIDHRFDCIRNQIILDYQTQLLFEEIAKLPRTTDTSYVPPDVVDLADERLFDCERSVRND